MSITGSSSGDDSKTLRSSWTYTSSPQSVGALRVGPSGGGSSSSPRCVRIFRIEPGSVMNAISRMSPPQFGNAKSSLLRFLLQRFFESGSEPRVPRAFSRRRARFARAKTLAFFFGEPTAEHAQGSSQGLVFEVSGGRFVRHVIGFLACWSLYFSARGGIERHRFRQIHELMAAPRNWFRGWLDGLGEKPASFLSRDRDHSQLFIVCRGMLWGSGCAG